MPLVSGWSVNMLYVINGKFLTQQITGVQRYALEIIKQLDNLITDKQVKIHLLIPPHNITVPELHHIQIIKYGLKNKFLWEQISLARYIKQNKAIGIHLCNTVPLLVPRGITCIHDITYKINIQFISTKFLILARIWHLIQYRIAIKNALHLITVSEYSKKQIIETYHISESRISVIYNGWQHFSPEISSDLTLQKYPFLTDREYFFSLATFAKNKNFKWIIESAKLYPDNIYVIAGKMDKKRLGEHIGSIHNVIHIGYISDDDIKLLLKHCKAFIFPSLYEGFGIPPLEALAMGAPVICSTAACLPEIFGHSVHYIDPYITNTDLNKLLEEPVETAEIVLTKYSWKKSAQALLNIIYTYT